MSDKNKDESSPFHENSLHVTAFLGGTTFAAMVLIIEFRGSELFSHWLIAGTALVSFLFTVSTVGHIHISSNEINKDSAFAKFIELLGTMGFWGLGIILPLLTYSFSSKGGIMVGVIEGIIMAIFMILRHNKGQGIKFRLDIGKIMAFFVAFRQKTKK